MYILRVYRTVEREKNMYDPESNANWVTVITNTEKGVRS